MSSSVAGEIQRNESDRPAPDAYQRRLRRMPHIIREREPVALPGQPGGPERRIDRELWYGIIIGLLLGLLIPFASFFAFAVARD